MAQISLVDVTVAIHRVTPAGRWELVDVTFPTIPNTDLTIPHGLQPLGNEEVYYTVVRQATSGTIYEVFNEAGARSSQRNYLVLRSDTAEWHGRLLLTIIKSDATGIGGFV